jgi:hypothetical protein
LFFMPCSLIGMCPCVSAHVLYWILILVKPKSYSSQGKVTHWSMSIRFVNPL